MSAVEIQLAIDRLKVELVKSSLDEGPDKEEMRRRIVALQMKLRNLRDEEEEMVSLCTFTHTTLHYLAVFKPSGSFHFQCGEGNMWTQVVSAVETGTRGQETDV